MSIITILHISDTHFGTPYSAGNQALVTRKLIDAIEEHLNQERHHPPFICVFSGDVSYSADDSNFKRAEAWLNDLSRAVGSIPFFIVPGNHDVRRPQTSKKCQKVIREFEAAGNNEGAYAQWIDRVGKSKLLLPFFSWHEDAKKRLNITSTWDVTSPFICHYSTSVADINVHLIGLNTSILSCRDKEMEKLVADINCLQEALAKTSTDKELVILVTHHPIKVDEKLERWLAEWNDTQLANIVLRQTGPHLYLHGHLHESIGIGTSQSTGQYLGLFAAGAAYQHERYPMKFGFYDICITERYIKPWVYGFDRSSGGWTMRSGESNYVFTFLPVPPKAGKKELRGIVDALQTERDGLIQERESLRKAYKYCHQAASRLFREMHPTPNGEPIHHYERVQSYYRISGNGDAAINETVVIFPNGQSPIHFWEYGIWADPESPEVPFLEDISWNVSVEEGKNMTYLPTRDDGREKWICIFFLPMIRKDEKRTVNISYQWPAFVRHLIDGDRVQFEWRFKTGLPLVPINVDLILDFDPDCGELEFKQESSHDPESEWTSKRTENGGTRLEYKCENGLSLHKGYTITVWKCDSSTSKSACAGHF
jgi:3',5'-cyclic AMP phosphodiesterase CpdA